MQNEAFSMDLYEYLHQTYQQQGYEATHLAIIDFLKMWEGCSVGPENPVYDIEGILVTREVYATRIADDIKAIWDTIQGKSNVSNENDNWEEQENLELLENIQAYIKQKYQEYATLIEEIERLEQERDNTCEEFARCVSVWAHYKFEKPEHNPQSVTIYTAVKQLHLKLLVPGYSNYRALAINTKQVDHWTRIGNDSSRSVGICSEPVQQEITMSSDAEESDMSRLPTHVDFRNFSEI